MFCNENIYIILFYEENGMKCNERIILNVLRRQSQRMDLIEGK